MRIDGVARPPAVTEFLAADKGMLGPRECLGGRAWYKPGRGVTEAFAAMELFRIGMGVIGEGLPVTETSDSGGDGGVASGSDVSGFVCGGVEAAVGDERPVADVDVSDTGERGRNVLPDSRLPVLRWWCLSTVSSAMRSFSCTISASMRRSDSSSRSRCVSIRSLSRSCSPILISSSSMTVRSMATLYLDSRSSNDDVWWRAWRSKSSFCTSMSRSFICSARWDSRKLVISF